MPFPSARLTLPEIDTGAAVGGEKGVQVNVRGVTISDQPFNVLAAFANWAWSETRTRHVPSVLVPLKRLNWPTGSAVKPKPAHEALFTIGFQLPVNGAEALGARSRSPAAESSISVFVRLSPVPPPPTPPPIALIRSVP